MAMRHASHCVYDVKYHLVWAPKYRKWILRGEIRKRVEELFRKIAGSWDIEIEEMEIAEEHVHLFVSFPPRHSISTVVGVLKCQSASAIFREHPEVKKELWGGEFWEDGYFVRSVGDKVTADLIKKYIQHHREVKDGQLKLF
jgi:putative transposase